MKRFDKGYVYYSLLTDFFASLFILFTIFNEILIDEESNEQTLLAALPFVALAFIVIYACFAAYRIAFYKTSGYELTETEIKCNRGVFFRKRSVLDYGRIHAVNKKQNIIHRIFGIAVLTVDSGSANTAHHAEITVVERDAAVDALIGRLNVLRSGGAQKSEAPFAEDRVLLSESDSLYSFTSKRKMLYTLINIVSAVFFIAVFAVLAISLIAACLLMLKHEAFGSWGKYFLYSALITLGAMLLFAVCIFIGYIINSFIGYYGFKITGQGDGISISYGLIEKHTNTFAYNRIKAVKITQGLICRMLGFATVKLEVIGYVNDSGNESSDIGVLVPFCKYDEIGEILGKILPDYVPDEKQTKAVSFFPFVSWFMLILGIVTGITLALTASVMLILNVSATIVATVATAILGAALCVGAVKLASAAIAYRTDGIAVNGRKITAYSGGIVKNVTVLTVNNLTSVENVTTPLRKRAGITDLVLHLKTNESSNEVKVHIQSDELSEKLEGLLRL